MTATTPGPGPGLGSRLRQVRDERGLSVRELARRAGCSASLISQIERGNSAPSAGILYALANELSVSLDHLFGIASPGPARSGAEPDRGQGVTLAVTGPAREATHAPWGRPVGPDGAGIVQRGKDRRCIELSTGVRWERLTPQFDARVDFMEVVYAPHGRSTDAHRSIRHDGREYLLVIQGQLYADIGFETYELQAGDSLAFDPLTPHQYRNMAPEVARCLSVVVHDPQG